MKNVLIIAATAALALSSCSKDSNLTPNQQINEGVNEVQRSVENGFILGALDASNNATISYDLALLEDICACAVGENSASGLGIAVNTSGDYFLTGQANSDVSNTAFAVELTLDTDNQLIWSASSAALTCKNDANSTCNLTLANGLDYSCSAASGTCVKTPIGDGYAHGSEPCDWPWMAKSSKDRK